MYDENDRAERAERPESVGRILKDRSLSAQARDIAVTPLQSALMRQEEAAYELTTQLERLEERLSPVISPHPVASATDGNKRGGGSQVVDQIWRVTDRIEGQTERVRYIIEGLEV